MKNDDVLIRIESTLDQILKLIALQSTSEMKQADAIQFLDSVAFDRRLIAELLKTTPNTVSVTLSKSKDKKKSSRKNR